MIEHLLQILALLWLARACVRGARAETPEELLQTLVYLGFAYAFASVASFS